AGSGSRSGAESAPHAVHSIDGCRDGIIVACRGSIRPGMSGMRGTTTALLFVICAGCATLPELDGNGNVAAAGRGAYVDDDAALRSVAAFTGSVRARDERRSPERVLEAREQAPRATARDVPPSPLAAQAASVESRLDADESAHWLLDRNADALDVR